MLYLEASSINPDDDSLTSSELINVSDRCLFEGDTMFDLLLKGGRIYDGSGMPSFTGDVAVAGGKIAAIGRLNGSARRTLNVEGLAVTPGFIYPHTHLDAQLLWDPLGT